LRRSLIRFAEFAYQCRLGALTYWSATIAASPPCSVRNEAERWRGTNFHYEQQITSS
jgi:hypothetical protein